MNQLTVVENQQLEAHEQVIARGFETFVEVGEALQAIRDNHLYRAQYSSFKEYCEGRWGFGDNYARKHIRAFETFTNLKSGTIVPSDPLPIAESQVRPLTSLEANQQREVWQAAVKLSPNGKPTAAHVQQAKKSMAAYQDFDDGWGDYDEDEAPIIKHATSNSREVLHSSESQEWYTPAEYALAVHRVMGDIDLDPASCDFANETIGARRYFVIDDDGLKQQWSGRVFLNPPYGKTGNESNQGTWADALVWHYEQGGVTEAILLVNATPGNKWFAPLWNYPICFVDHRIKFYNAAGEADQPPHSSCFVYLGSNRDKFAQVFSQFGVVAVRYEVL